MKSIRKNVEKHLDEQKKRQQKRKIEYENRENYGTKKFGRYKFEAPDLDLNLSDEITGNLRTMKVTQFASGKENATFIFVFLD